MNGLLIEIKSVRSKLGAFYCKWYWKLKLGRKALWGRYVNRWRRSIYGHFLCMIRSRRLASRVEKGIGRELKSRGYTINPRRESLAPSIDVYCYDVGKTFRDFNDDIGLFVDFLKKQPYNVDATTFDGKPFCFEASWRNPRVGIRAHKMIGCKIEIAEVLKKEATIICEGSSEV